MVLEGQALTEQQVHAALAEAGLDLEHNAEIQESRIWVNQEDQVESSDRLIQLARNTLASYTASSLPHSGFMCRMPG